MTDPYDNLKETLLQSMARMAAADMDKQILGPEHLKGAAPFVTHGMRSGRISSRQNDPGPSFSANFIVRTDCKLCGVEIAVNAMKVKEHFDRGLPIFCSVTCGVVWKATLEDG